MTVWTPARLLTLLMLVIGSASIAIPKNEGYVRPGCGKLLWLVGFQLKTTSGGDTFYMAKTSEYVEALKVAILSAREHAPSLLPIVVITGPASSEGAVLSNWLHRHNSLVVRHDLSFKHDMEELRKDPEYAFSEHVQGSWLRVDLPSVLGSLHSALRTSPIPERLKEDFDNTSKDYVLWTDPDVIFKRHIDSCTLARPQILSVGPEMRMGRPENYGVIYFNVSGYAEAFEGLIGWARQHEFHFDHDQNLFVGYWGTAVNTLPNGMNWKPYWGDPSTAIPGRADHEVIYIVHFHGPKLKTACCFFDELKKDPKSGKDSMAIDTVRKCGLKDAPVGHVPISDSVWLQVLVNILTASYSYDGGRFYESLLAEFVQYISAAEE